MLISVYYTHIIISIYKIIIMKNYSLLCRLNLIASYIINYTIELERLYHDQQLRVYMFDLAREDSLSAKSWGKTHSSVVWHAQPLHENLLGSGDPNIQNNSHVH